MLSGAQNQAGSGARRTAIAAAGEAASTDRQAKQSTNAISQQVSLTKTGSTFGPEGILAWATGLLGVGACVAPWVAHGWLLFGLIVAAVSLATCYDALALWVSRHEGEPILLMPERGLRGREGQTLQIPLGITGSARGKSPGEIVVTIMATTAESESAIRVEDSTRILKLEAISSERFRRVGIRSDTSYQAVALGAGDCVAAPRHLACSTRRDRAAIALRVLASAAMVRSACAPSNRGRHSGGPSRNSAEPDLSIACGIATVDVGRPRTRFRTVARISARRQLFGDCLEIDRAPQRTGDAFISMGAEAGSVFRGGSISSVRSAHPIVRTR